jgi:endoribonuclease Dicer
MLLEIQQSTKLINRKQYASLIERYNREQEERLQLVRDAEVSSPRLCNVAKLTDEQNIMKLFCESLPEDRILKGNDWVSNSAPSNEVERAYTIKSSGARLTYHSALAVLARYASSLVSSGIWFRVQA